MEGKTIVYEKYKFLLWWEKKLINRNRLKFNQSKFNLFPDCVEADSADHVSEMLQQKKS